VDGRLTVKRSRLLVLGAVSASLLVPPAGRSTPQQSDSSGSFVQYMPGTKFLEDRGSSPAVVSSGGKIVWLSGVSALVDSKGKSLAGDFDGQAEEVFARIDRMLKRAGGSIQDVVVWTIYMNEDRYGQQFGKLRHDQFPTGNFPGSARIVVSNFEKPGVLIEIQAVAVIAERHVIHQAAPLAATPSSLAFSVRPVEGVKDQDGNDSPAVVTQGAKIVWLSGETALVDSSGKPLLGDFDGQAREVFARMDRTLKRAGGSLKNVVAWTVFVNDPRYGERLGKVFPGGNFPGTARIAVSNFEKPGVLVEIQAVAAVAKGATQSPSGSIQYLDNTEERKDSASSPAVITEGGRTTWLLGESGGAAGTANFEAHVRSAFDTIQKNLADEGANLKNLVSLKVFIKGTAANSNDFSKVMHDVFPDGKYPATTVVNVTYSPELIEIQGVAVVP
jgi:2-iminobutanoate/2-iminopropanoate deaminase